MLQALGALTPLSPSSNAPASSNAAASTSGQVGASFADLVAAAAGHTVGAMRGAEQLSVEALQGQADVREVVDAVMSAEQSFQAAVAIRDKIVTAYLEVSRMAI